jgi:cell division septum initiation protein DivIVA
MSASPGDQRPRQSTSRAAELAAQQVESIVAAATESAQKLTTSAREEAASVRALAKETAQNELEAAEREASARIREAQAAADDVLAEAKAVSGGMRQLAHLLTTHAERILRDVQNSHRAISADLRAASAGKGGRDESAAADEGRAREQRPARPSASSIENPFADLDPPEWVEEKRDAS